MLLHSSVAVVARRFCRPALLFFLIGVPATVAFAQPARDLGRGMQGLDLQGIAERRALVTGGVFAGDEGGDANSSSRQMRRSRLSIPFRDRNIMPVFPEVAPGTVPLIPSMDPGGAPADITAIGKSCRDAVARVINDLQSPRLRERWYAACTETQLPADFNILIQAAGGLTEAGQDKYFCSGVLLDSRTLITAKHCFFDSRTGYATPQWELLKEGKIEFKSGLGRFALSCGDGRPHTAGCISRFPGSFGLSNDRIFLAVNNLPQASFGGVQMGRVKVGDELVLYGHFDESVERRYSKAPGCRVQAISSACVVHGCQADHSSSGAGLFFRDADGKYKLGGIHLSGATESSDCGFSAAVQSNIGLFTPH